MKEVTVQDWHIHNAVLVFGLSVELSQSDSDSSSSSSEPLDSASASLSPSLGRLTRFSSPPPLLLRPEKQKREKTKTKTKNIKTSVFLNHYKGCQNRQIFIFSIVLEISRS